MVLEDIGTILLPYETVEKSAGFSFDMGGSVLKVAYRHKDDWTEAQKNKGEKAKVRLVSFPRTDLDEAIKLLHTHCHTTQGGDITPTVYSTGLGGYQYGPKMEEEFNASIEVLAEFDCFVKAFVHFINNSPKKDILQPISDSISSSRDMLEKSVTIAKEKLQSEKQNPDSSNTDKTELDDNVKGCKEKSEDLSDQDDTRPLGETTDITYPCLLAMLGSGIGWMKVDEDGSFGVVDGSMWGGRAFLGLGALLTGAQSFSELISLAEKGNHRNVDIFEEDLVGGQTNEVNTDMIKNEQDDLIGLLQNKQPVFCFGKATKGKMEDFNREDLAASLLQASCMMTAHTLVNSIDEYKIKNVYVCGSFVNTQHVRDVLAEKVMHRIASFGTDRPEMVALNPTIDFVKGGSHLGALGAFMYAK